jgi:hypothetical protein
VRGRFLTLLLLICVIAPEHVSPQEEFCGITPQSARRIAEGIILQTSHAYDSVSSAYYVSVLAPRLSPYYVIYYIKAGYVVGVIEIDMCGRLGTPHPGLQYVPDSDLLLTDVLLEPDAAFAVLKAQTGAEAAFATRVFPFGLTRTQEELAGIDFWWLILDSEGTWHYMTKRGELREVGGRPADSGQPVSDSAGHR